MKTKKRNRFIAKIMAIVSCFMLALIVGGGINSRAAATSVTLTQISRPNDVATNELSDKGLIVQISTSSSTITNYYQFTITERSWVLLDEYHDKYAYGWASGISLYKNASLTQEVSETVHLSNYNAANSRLTGYYLDAGTYYLSVNVVPSMEMQTIYGYVLPVSKVMNITTSNVDCSTNSVTVSMVDSTGTTSMINDTSLPSDINDTYNSGVWGSDATKSATDQYSITANGSYSIRAEFSSNEWKNFPVDITFTVSNLKNHVNKTITTPATTKKDGSYYNKCSVCGKISGNTSIKRISSVSLSKTKYTYTGQSIKPSITVKDLNGKTISKNNYTVTYKSNKNPGKATVTVKFKGNYSGTVTKTFTIAPKATSISKVTPAKKGFTVKWKKQQGTGYEIQYSTSISFAKSKTKTATVKSVNTTSKTISKLKAKTKYYIRIRAYKTVSGGKIYSGWSKTKSVKTK